MRKRKKTRRIKRVRDRGLETTESRDVWSIVRWHGVDIVVSSHTTHSLSIPVDVITCERASVVVENANGIGKGCGQALITLDLASCDAVDQTITGLVYRPTFKRSPEKGQSGSSNNIIYVLMIKPGSEMPYSVGYG